MKQEQLALLDGALSVVAFSGALEIANQGYFVIEFVIFAGDEEGRERDELQLLLVESMAVHGDVQVGNGNVDDERALFELVTQLVDPVH